MLLHLGTKLKNITGLLKYEALTKVNFTASNIQFCRKAENTTPNEENNPPRANAEVIITRGHQNHTYQNLVKTCNRNKTQIKLAKTTMCEMEK